MEERLRSNELLDVLNEKRDVDVPILAQLLCNVTFKDEPNLILPTVYYGDLHKVIPCRLMKLKAGRWVQSATENGRYNPQAIWMLVEAAQHIRIGRKGWVLDLKRQANAFVA